jgi:translin
MATWPCARSPTEPSLRPGPGRGPWHRDGLGSACYPDSGAAGAVRPGRPELAGLIGGIRAELDGVHRAREAGLAACRRTIRAAGSAIRAVHRLDPGRAAALTADCRAALREAQAALAPYPAIASAGFLHDAEKEYAEAVLTAALVGGAPLPDHHELAVGLPAWLNGLAEAASELRRHLLDRLRERSTEPAEGLLASMEDVYELLVGVDYPDAVTGGLRRSADALRAVLERTRSDVTTTVLQQRLQAAIEGRLADGSGPDRPVR